MTLDQIRYFLEVAWCRNFSAAARNLYISQPNLTKYIASLEKELGARLFIRTTRKVELTEYGEQFLNQAENLFLPFLRACEDLQSEIKNRRRAIYIGIPRDETIPASVMDLIREKNLRQNPEVFILSHDSAGNLIDGLQNRKYHLIVSSDRNARAMVDTRYQPLQPLHMMLAISIHHPLASREGLTIADLSDEMVFFSAPGGMTSPGDLAQSLHHRLGAMVNIRFLDSHADVLSCVQSCAGAAIIPDLADRRAYPDILFLPFQDNREDTAMQAMVWRNDETDPAVTELIQDICSCISRTPQDVMQPEQCREES